MIALRLKQVARYPRVLTVSLAVLALGAAAPVMAQSWTPPDQQVAQAGEPDKALIDELRTLIERGEKERLADPWYLKDLRALVDRYDWPWRVRIMSEDFSARGPQPPAPWQVTAGEFLIDWRHGLRSVIEPPPQAQTGTTTGQKQSTEEAVGALIGTILQQSLGGQQTGTQAGTQAGTETGNPGFAAVKAPVAISNAFAIEMELSSRALPGLVDGRFEFGPYQGAQAGAGYRLAYTANPSPGTPSLELLRHSSRGTSTLELHDQPLKLEDQQAHTLVWTRDKAGAMAVSLDGQELFQVTDRSFRDPFDGFAAINSGGDYALRRITIDGTQ
jgi:hypothetical protein